MAKGNLARQLQLEEAATLLLSPGAHDKQLPGQAISHVAHLLDEDRRRDMSLSINVEILSMMQSDRDRAPDLKDLVRLILHTQRDLEQQADFPMVDEGLLLSGST